MKTSHEIRAALRSISQGVSGIRHDALAMRVYSLLEDENLTIPEEFQTAANTAAEILDNINAAQRPPQPADLLAIAADPKKLKAHLTDSATAAAMTATLRKDVITELNRTVSRAAVKAAGAALKEFMAANSNSGLYGPASGTEGEQMVAQEKRNRLNAIHDQLLRASVGGERLDESAAICCRWTYHRPVGSHERHLPLELQPAPVGQLHLGQPDLESPQH